MVIVTRYKVIYPCIKVDHNKRKTGLVKETTKTIEFRLPLLKKVENIYNSSEIK